MANTKVALRRRQARTTKLSRGVAAGSAYTITDRGFTEIAAGTSGVTTLDSGTWTPVAGSLLVAIPAHEGRYLSVPIQFSLTDTFPGTSGWVESATAFKLGQPNYGFRVSMFTTVVTSTGSGHVTLTRSPSDTVDQYTFFQIYEITGQAATAWIGATGSQAEYPAPTSSTCTVTMWGPASGLYFAAQIQGWNRFTGDNIPVQTGIGYDQWRLIDGYAKDFKNLAP